MKLLYKYYLISILIIGFSFSCTDLDETIYDRIPADEFGNNQAQINSIIAPIYRTLKGVWPGDGLVLAEQTGDMAITPTRIGGDWYDGGVHQEFARHTWQPRNSVINGMWNNANSGVSTCNKVLALIKANQAIEESRREQVYAEIRGVRAFWLYMLVDYFGNVPLVTDFDDQELPKTTSRKEVYSFIIDELNAVKDLLPSDVSAVTYGKFTKGAAYFLLAKMYLNAEIFNGTVSETTFTKGAAEWQKCIDACDEVLKLPYILEPNWKLNFEVKNEASKEIIFPCVFSSNDGGNHLFFRTLHYRDPLALGISISPWNGISANPDYVNQFDDADKRKEGSFLIGEIRDAKTGEILITQHGRELNHTIDIPMIDGSTAKYDGIWGEVQQEVGARCFKWVIEPGLSSDAENDFAFFRLADVYLMKAEALVRMNRNAEALPLINAIRKRAFDSDDNLLTAVTLDDVYMERRFEMAWECYSRQDNIRFGNFLKPRFLKPETTPVYRMLMPIPVQALEANNQLTQNPGYPGIN